MMGAGGAMMLWRLAWLRVFPNDTPRGMPPYTPSIAPWPRKQTTPWMPASWEYTRLLHKIEVLQNVFDSSPGAKIMCLHSPRPTLYTDTP